MYTSLKEAQGELEMAAMYIAGENKSNHHQFHIQLTAVAVEGDEESRYDTMRCLLKTPSHDILKTSNDHIVFVCAALGQLDHENPENWVRRGDNEDVTCNATIQVTANEKDNTLWDIMDQSIFEVLKSLTPDEETLEYWDSETKKWKKDHPSSKQLRSGGLVHPASTMWIGNTESDPVNLEYRFRGVENVYLTGGALWPTAASWNPTCGMTAMAMDLADKLNCSS